MRDALPYATYLGFTGTPIESTDVNTPAVFGNYIDVYDIAQAVEDGATVRIFYESRLAKISLSEEGKKLVADLDATLAQDDLTETQKAKAKWTQLEALIGSENRIKQVAQDIIEHFEHARRCSKERPWWSPCPEGSPLTCITPWWPSGPSGTPMI
jgi:type I restriction enzyme, R subunit